MGDCMRKIEFRVWVKDELKMAYSRKGERFISLEGSYYRIIYNMSNQEKIILSKEDDENICVMQYTGLKDKIIRAFIPEFPKFSTPHTHYGYSVLNTFHRVPPYIIG